MAEEKPYLTGRTYIFRLPKGKDLLESLSDFCHDNQVKCGVVNVIGSVANATVGYYDQAKKKYEKKYRDLLAEYKERFGPLVYTDVFGTETHDWIKDPWPWEREGN